MGNYYSSPVDTHPEHEVLIKNDFNIQVTLVNKNLNNSGILRDRNVKQYMKNQKFKDLINSRLVNCQNKPKMKKCLSVSKENNKYLLNLNIELENLEYTGEVSINIKNKESIIANIKEEINKYGLFWEDSKNFEHFMIKDIHLIY
jgi:hypothetical protein